jgi:hypothetical protein
VDRPTRSRRRSRGNPDCTSRHVACRPGMKGLPPLPTGTSPKKNRDMPLNEGGWSREAMNTRPRCTESLCVR